MQFLVLKMHIHSEGVFMGIHIGGAKAWKQTVFGDIVVTFDWVNDEPAMLITPKVVKIQGAYVICLSSAYKYTSSQYLIQQSVACAKHIGMDGGSRFTVTRIADAIMECIQDLCEMPPEQMARPAEKGKVVGDMVVKVNGKTVVEKEMLESHP